MKFADRFPKAKVNEQVEFEGSTIVLGTLANRCWCCREETRWIDLGFLAPMCSEECSRKKWEEYRKALLGIVDIVSLANPNGNLRKG